MEKTDYKKELKHLYFPSAKEATMVDVPKMNFTMIDGQGDPNTSMDFQQAIEALYGISYTSKFMLKKGGSDTDYVVPPLEGLWWAEDMTDFLKGDREAWKWTLMIMQPPYVTAEIFVKSVDELREKKNPPALSRVRLEAYHEGLSAQIMHIGPFSEEGPTIAMLHAFIKEHGHAFDGKRQKHHEIYMSDMRKTQPEKLKTVIRQPVRKK
jgi:hypothetical protein